MIIFFQIFSFCIFTSIFPFVLKSKHKKEQSSVSFKNLHIYISQQNKKRNFNTQTSEIQHKNSNYLSKSLKNKNKFKYKKLKQSYLSLNMKIKKSNNLTFVERNNQKLTNHLFLLSKKIDNKINSEKRTFRSISGECLIETIATSFANEVLIEEEFNMFSSFKQICTFSKIYKKEAEILNILIIAKLIDIYQILQNQIYDIKKKVLQGKTLKHIKKNTPDETIYGAYILNKSASKLFMTTKTNIIKATNNVLEKLDEIEEKQKKIFCHVRLLEKTL